MRNYQAPQAHHPTATIERSRVLYHTKFASQNLLINFSYCLLPIAYCLSRSVVCDNRIWYQT
jgi:hypothetical protein